MREDMKLVPGGIFSMGSERFYAEESPVVRVRVSDFMMDEAPVTNAQFAAFVAATGHVTLAEQPPRLEDYPGLRPEAAVAGSAVFDNMALVPGSPEAAWWSFRAGAEWRHPFGSGSSTEGIEDHPVIHVAYADAQAYAVWAGKSLPTEAQWELAARGGLKDADYAWGDELAPDGRMMANYWQGPFPHRNDVLDGWERTSPVRAFPANGYGLFDLIGNVWEWTSDWWSLRQAVHHDQPAKSCCIPQDPHGGVERDSHEPGPGIVPIARKVIKGGSHLCAPNYCQRYRPAARLGQAIDTSTSHIGFRCVLQVS